jgi:hypothetical protein
VSYDLEIIPQASDSGGRDVHRAACGGEINEMTPEQFNIQLQHALHEAIKKLRVAEGALNFYATATYEAEYSRSIDANGEQIIYEPTIIPDCGDLAREALKQIRETKE